MVFCAEWITHKGTIIDDNQDYCSIAVNGNKTLCVVADGSTRSEQSGYLADEFVKTFADWFAVDRFLIGVEQLAAFVDEMSQRFKISYPAGRLSFLALLDSGDSPMTAFHAGDCRLGRINSNDTIVWLSRAHTLANAVEGITEEQLASHNGRHTLTRSFRPGRKCDVEVNQYSLATNDRLIIATDGYWAELNHEQKLGFIAKGYVPTAIQRDDVSCLVLSPIKSKTAQIDEGTENFYFSC